MLDKIGLGTVQFGLDYGISNKDGITSCSEVEKIIEYSRKIGIKLIDTAFGYGKSEEVLGNIGINDFKIVSKFLPATSEYSISDQVNFSIQRLKIGNLYGLLAHRPIDLLDKPEIWEFLENLKYSSIVKKIGFSFNEPFEVDMLLEKGYFPDIVQVPYNYLDHRFEQHMIELKNKGCEIHTRSTFLQGLFFMEPDILDNFFAGIKPVLKDLQTNGRALPGMLLNNCLQKPFIDKIIIGVNNRFQLLEIIENLEDAKRLTENHLSINPEILTPSKWPKI